MKKQTPASKSAKNAAAAKKSNKPATKKEIAMKNSKDAKKPATRKPRQPKKENHPVKEKLAARARTKEIKSLAKKISKAKVESIKALGLAVKQARKVSLQKALKARAKQVSRLADLGITRVQYGALIEHYKING